jgi:hypothetical protein
MSHYRASFDRTEVAEVVARVGITEIEPDDILTCIAYHAVVANESLDAIVISGR